jgi:hypothetical protein
MDGIHGARIWCGHGVLAHNLVKVSSLLEPGTARQHEHRAQVQPPDYSSRRLIALTAKSSSGPSN